jgi:uncharacterized protein (DUF305 family)
MNNETVKYAIGGAIIGGLIVWFSTMGYVNTGTYGMPMMGWNRQNTQAYVGRSNSIDSHFIEQMIPHHEDAITMAQLAQTKATRPEIKQLAENIIDSQSKEITNMKSWYKTWFGKEVPEGDDVMGGHGMMGKSGMHMGMMGDETDVADLENSQDFDRDFIRHMIPHHQMAVMMAQMLQNSTEKSEMKTLADDIIKSQSAEIEQMREWYSEWESSK